MPAIVIKLEICSLYKKRGSFSFSTAMSESTGLVRVSRSSKCAISIAEIAQDGTFCRLENGSASKVGV